MPPNAPANVGKANIRSWAESFLGAFRTKFTLSVAELQVVTDRAFESGAYSITLLPTVTADLLKMLVNTVYQRFPLVAGPWPETSGTATNPYARSVRACPWRCRHEQRTRHGFQTGKRPVP